jgi:hypothetical protein
MHMPHCTHPLARSTECGAALQYWVNDRVNVLITPLKQEGEAILNGQLQLLQEVRIMERLDLSQATPMAAATHVYLLQHTALPQCFYSVQPIDMPKLTPRP